MIDSATFLAIIFFSILGWFMFDNLRDLFDTYRKYPHVHTWVDARNRYVKSGEICASCGSVRRGNESSDDE